MCLLCGESSNTVSWVPLSIGFEKKPNLMLTTIVPVTGCFHFIPASQWMEFSTLVRPLVKAGMKKTDKEVIFY